MSCEEQGLCPYNENPAFDAGMVFYVANYIDFDGIPYMDMSAELNHAPCWMNHTSVAGQS